jgi:hypothetical protein
MATTVLQPPLDRPTLDRPTLDRPTLDRVDGVERRVCGRAVAAWRRLAAPRRYPARAQLDAVAPDDLKDHLFVLRVADDDPATVTCVEAGPVMRRAIGCDPTGRRAADVLPPGVREPMLAALRHAVATGAPVDHAGRWARGADDVVYRAVLMPLSDDQRTVNYVLGAFNFRTIAYS